MHFLDGYSIRAALSPLSQSEIIEAALPVVIERGIIKTREDLYLIIAGLPSSTQVKIREAALAKQALGEPWISCTPITVTDSSPNRRTITPACHYVCASNKAAI